MEGPTEEVPECQDDQFLAYSEDEDGELTLQEEQEEQGKKEVSIEDPDIDDYCRRFVDFMQAQLHKKYELISSRKRTRVKD